MSFEWLTLSKAFEKSSVSDQFVCLHLYFLQGPQTRGPHNSAEDGQACYRWFLSLFVFLFNISPNVSQSSLCISSNSVNAGAPR